MNVKLLKKYRPDKAVPVTDAEIAKHLGVTRQAFFLWIKGKQIPSTENQEKLARFLRVAVDDLFPEVYEEKIQ